MKERRLAKISKFADNIFVLNPDLKHFLPDAEFLPYASVDLKQWRAVENHPSGDADDRVTILHAPSNRSIKGTEHVIQACTKLEKEGYPVRLVLAENVPHAEMKTVYESADIFVDQLLVGWYGAAAVEAMALGKPSICYLRESDIAWLPFKESIPVISATRDTIYATILYLLENRHYLKELGLRSRMYVEDVHDPVKIALQMKRTYEL
jgi:glycosyltransferase involved in cell wall biosynthesis